MDILLKIIIIQAIILVGSFLALHPSTMLADYVEHKFGDYGKGLDIILNTQFVLVAITTIIWAWRW